MGAIDLLDDLPWPRPDAGAACPLEAEATLALGRLDGALAHCDPATLRLFAARMLRDTLLAALRQEGHAFTDSRFYAWFAGIATLSDEPPRRARPPRALGEAILTELAHSPWEPLADLAARLGPALLAPRDFTAPTGHEDVHAIVAAARRLVGGLAPSPLPVPALARLHQAIGRDTIFAPPERAHEPVVRGSLRLSLARAPLPAPRWAIEMLWGEHWRAAGTLRCALPFPGLIRLDAVRDGATREDAHIAIATALRDVACAMFDALGEAGRLARRIAELRSGRRSTSRAPALFEVLAGFGPMRSAQLETMLGATRLGVRAMLDALGAAGVLERNTVCGVRLYSVSEQTHTPLSASGPPERFAFSRAALDEYDASMAGVDELLARSGVTVDAGERPDLGSGH